MTLPPESRRRRKAAFLPIGLWTFGLQMSHPSFFRTAHTGLKSHKRAPVLFTLKTTPSRV